MIEPLSDASGKDQIEKIHILQARLEVDADESSPILEGDTMLAISETHPGDMIHHDNTAESDEAVSYSLIHSLAWSAEAVPIDYDSPVQSPDLEGEYVDWKVQQAADENIRMVLGFVAEGRKPQGTSEFPKEVGLMLNQFGKLRLREGVLYRRVVDTQEKECFQLVLPSSFREKAIVGVHNELGHLGAERAVALARRRFYWPKMATQIEEWVSNCARCVSYKTTQKVAAPLVNITTTCPLDLVCIDFLKLEPDCSGAQYILVVTDHFSRYAQAYPTRDKSSRTVARVLWEKYFLYCGLPRRVHSVQGREFDNKLIKELTHLLGIRKSRTTPYHPQGDPQPERFNRTLLSILGTLPRDKKENWSKFVGLLVHAYNCTRNDSTGFSSVLHHVWARGMNTT